MRAHPSLWLALAGWLWLAGSPGRATGDESAGASYTAAELEALDRALHAVNMDRRDLGFRKDVAEGHAALSVVRELLADPLRIAPEIDAWAALARTGDRRRGLLERAVHTLARPGGEAPLPAPPGWAGPLPARPQEALAALAAGLAEANRAVAQALPAAWTAEDPTPLRALRQALPGQMDWHEVYASPYPEAEARRLAEHVKAKDPAWLHREAARLDVGALARAWVLHVEPLIALARALPPEAFPPDRPVEVETPHGRVALGTPGPDRYTGAYAVLIEPAGDDHYLDARLGAGVDPERARVGVFVDRGGADRYACGATGLTLGAAVLGLGAALDLGAMDDRYEAGPGSLGAALCGIALFHDDGGSDRYEGQTFTQGAAGFGIALFDDDAVQPVGRSTPDEGTPDPVEARLLDNDVLLAFANAQGFARCRGVALCLNRRGNDTFQAGGVYLHAPLFADRYQSFSQGFAIGERAIDYAGGLALLIDLDGNDRYLGDVYNQGVGYWYAAGLLYDGAGNDHYEMTQYGQGSGIHLAVGGLVDAAGSDTYVLHSGLGQGGSHDYAASLLHDRGGDDRYLGMTSCNGCGLTNSVGLHVDRAGDDTYAGRRGSLNSGRAARGFGSIGVLLDLGGEDHWLGIGRDDALWRHTDVGVGLDERSRPPDPLDRPEPEPGPEAPLPEACAYEGPLTRAAFDALWALATRWEVGENRRIVPRARERLVAFGPPVLAELERVMDTGASGLEVRAWQAVLGGLSAAGHAEPVRALLARALTAGGPRQRLALALVGEFGETALEAAVAGLLESPDPTLARRAAQTLERLKSRAGDATLAAWLAAGSDELRVQAALGPWLGRGAEAYPAVRGLLDHPLLSVRTRLVDLLAGGSEALRAAWRADLGAEDLSPRARRSLLDALARTQGAGVADTLPVLVGLLEDPDWGVRADAVRALVHLEGLEAAPEATRARARAALEAHAAGGEAEPYVRFWLAGFR